jgi:hypothetical protein
MSLLDALTKLVDDQLAQEGITPQLLAMIDLSVAYSPVIPFAGGTLENAVDVRAWGFVPDDVLPRKFEVLGGGVHNPVSHDSLKVMRARYLLAREAHYAPLYATLFGEPDADDSDPSAICGDSSSQDHHADRGPNDLHRCSVLGT